MTGDNDLDTLLKLGLGYVLGSQQNNDWKLTIDNFKKRVGLLQYPKIPIPWGFLNLDKNMKLVYREGLLCYLHGLPNACIPSMVRVLEQSLEKKHEITVGKSSRRMSLEDLIDWADSFLDNKTDTAHAFRMLRNYIHTNNVVQEADALEAIRHISIIVNNLHPVELVDVFPTPCPKCGIAKRQKIDSKMTYLAQTHPLTCESCHNRFTWTLFP